MRKFLTAMSAAASAVALLAVPAFAAGSTVKTYQWNGIERWASADGTYYAIYSGNNNGAVTLKLTADGNDYQPEFEVTKVDAAAVTGQWDYANIGQGDEWGMRPEFSWQPVRANDDGNPVTSVSAVLITHGTYNAGYDIWFNKTDNAAVKQNNGAEIMLWFGADRNGVPTYRGPGSKIVTTVKVDGIWWNVNSGLSCLKGICWDRTYFVAQHRISHFSGGLNSFFKVTEGFHMLNPAWWLTGIDYGFELNSTNTAGLAMYRYSLTGIEASNSWWRQPPNVKGKMLVVAQRILAKAGWTSTFTGPPFHRGEVRIVTSETRVGNQVRLVYKIEK